MTPPNDRPNTLADVLAIVVAADLAPTRRRDMISAINRFCAMAGRTPAGMPAEAQALRTELHKIRPAAFGISAKTLSTLRSTLAAALQLAGVLDDMARGLARQHPAWAPLLQAIGPDRRLADGLASFANWCAVNEISPEAVTDQSVKEFSIWLETRTHCPKPQDIVRRVPLLWNEASADIEGWPKSTLARISFRAPRKRLAWNDLSESFRRDAEAYLAGRANPDLFDSRPEAPRRPLAPSTIRQQREHLRLAASILGQSGELPASLAELIKPEHFKTILRYYHNKANREANAFAIALSKTLIQAARYHTSATSINVDELKRLAANLPAVPFDLTAKNKTLLRQLESERIRAKLLFLPDKLMGEVARDLEKHRVRFVEAQVAIAIDILLALPLRPQNLISLDWQRNFNEPHGPRGKLLLHIAAQDAKTKRRDIDSEVPDDVAQRLRWYRRHVLPCLGADVNGHLFVTEQGARKSQATLTVQIIDAIMRHIGIRMTPHQFRHFAATSYLEQHPEDFETAREILGHAWSKTTRIYAGSSSRRASRAYNQYLLKQREDLKLLRIKRKRAR